MTLQTSFEVKPTLIMQKPNGINSQAWEAHCNWAAQRCRQHNYLKEARKDSMGLENNSESDAVHNMFALLERCEENLKLIAAYTRGQELAWKRTTATNDRAEDVEMDDGASQTSACYFSDEETIWEQNPLDSGFIAPSVTETTDDDLRAALRELHEQVTETASETDVYSGRGCPDGLFMGREDDKNGDRLPAGASVMNEDEGNEIEYAHLRVTSRDHRVQLDNLSDEDHDGEQDNFFVDMSDIEENGYRSLSEILSEESELEPSEIFRVRKG